MWSVAGVAQHLLNRIVFLDCSLPPSVSCFDMKKAFEHTACIAEANCLDSVDHNHTTNKLGDTAAHMKTLNFCFRQRLPTTRAWSFGQQELPASDDNGFEKENQFSVPFKWFWLSPSSTRTNFNKNQLQQQQQLQRQQPCHRTTHGFVA